MSRPWLVGMAVVALSACGLAATVPRRLFVTDFGAVPNDGKDDTAAFAAALDRAGAVGPPEVCVPAGRYLVRNGRLRLRSGVVLRGACRARAVLQSVARGEPDAVLVPEGEDIVICDLAVRGRGEGRPPYFNHAGSLVVLREARHVRIERCRFEQFAFAVSGASALGGFYTVSDVVVRDCRFATGRVGVSAQACERLAVFASQFEGVQWASSTSRCLGSRFCHNDVRDAVTGVRGLHAFDVHVCHNTFRDVRDNGAVQFDTALHAEISHNLIDNQNSLAKKRRPWVWTIEVEAASGVVIQGNVIRASQHQDQIGIFLHGRFGGWHDWRINPFDKRRADAPGYETSFIDGARDEVAKWTVAQPAAVTVEADAASPWRDRPSFRLRAEPRAAPGVLAWRPFTEDQQHSIYGDVIVAFVAVRGNTAPPKALALALCMGKAGRRVAQSAWLPTQPKGHADKWRTYRTVMYTRGAGFGFARGRYPFERFQSIAVVLQKPLKTPIDLRIGTFRRAFAWQSNRDAGTVVCDNLVSNAATGLVMSQVLKNVSITNNLFEANQSRLNRGAEAIRLLTWHTVVRDPAKAVNRNDVPEDAPEDWVPSSDPWPTDPSALIYENCRIAGNRADGYASFITVAGIDKGRLILQEAKLGLVIESNQLQRTPQLLPSALPACIRVAGNSRDNAPTAGILRIPEGKPAVLQNPNLHPGCAVRFTPLSPRAFGHPLRVVSIKAGSLYVDPGDAPPKAVYGWEIWSDHLPR